MQAQIKLGKILGVRIGLHYSWLIIAVLIALSLVGHFQATNPAWGITVIWALSLVTAALFFASIIAHELSHAAVARARGLPVESITLFALGGVAQIKKESADPKSEFWMGIVGPLSSAAIGAVCLAIAVATGWTPWTTPQTPIRGGLVWLGYINLALAGFNMIPGFPLDGGRVLRAIVWWKTGDADRSTRIAARVGQTVAAIFIAWGLLQFFGGAGLSGLWLAFIGWFLLEVARASYAQVEILTQLRPVPVGQLMSRDCPRIDANLTVQDFVDHHLLTSGSRCFLIESGGRLEGLVTAHEVKQLDRSSWRETRLANVMRPLDRIHTVAPNTSAAQAFERMTSEDVNQIPVVSDGHVEGVVSRRDILHFLQLRGELHM
jgi:Zn-dependent protease/CBS domain-containing protein